MAEDLNRDQGVFHSKPALQFAVIFEKWWGWGDDPGDWKRQLSELSTRRAHKRTQETAGHWNLEKDLIFTLKRSWDKTLDWDLSSPLWPSLKVVCLWALVCTWHAHVCVCVIPRWVTALPGLCCVLSRTSFLLPALFFSGWWAPD